MKHFVRVIYVLSALVNSGICRETINVKCKELNSYYCHLERVNLEKRSYFIVPVSNEPQIVTYVDFRSSISDGSVVPIFSADGICSTFPELETLFIYEMHIEQLEPDAFKACTKLEDLSLRQNQFKYLSSSLFVNLKNVFRLDIYNNQLLDFDLEKVMDDLPKLKVISINYNRIECDRMKAMKQVADGKDIEFHDYPRPGEAKESYDYKCVAKSCHEEAVKNFILFDSASASLTYEERHQLSGDVTEFLCNNPNGDLGKCVVLSECDNLKLFWENKNMTQEEGKFLSKHVCGFVWLIPMVCCTEGPIYLTPTSPEPFWNRLPIAGSNECGLQTSDRIFGGNVTKIDEFPWLALLEYRVGGTIEHKCGGSLINVRYVLTAAHCIIPELSSVRLGEWDLSRTQDCVPSYLGEDCADPVQIIVIEQIIRHEHYRPLGAKTNDIALLRLVQPAKLSYFVKLICLPSTTALRNDYTVEGHLYTASGWGSTENGIRSDVKLKVELPGVTIEDCNKMYRHRGKTITSSQICAGGEEGKDTCQGDSGGPIMETALGLKGPYTYAAGIVSWGNGCGNAGWAGIYTRVGSFIDWIEANLVE